MIAVVIAGSLAGLFLPWANHIPAATICDAALKFMLVAVGYGMGCNGRPNLGSGPKWGLLALPLITIILTLLAGFVGAVIWGRPLAEGSAIVSGFGWYSLSAVIISNSGNQSLAASAFLSNLFRESIAILAIGFLQAAKRPLAGISAAGATSMDVSLPIISLYRSGINTPLSVYHGFLVSLAVPLIVPFCLSLLYL